MHEKRGQYEALFRDQPVWKSIFALAVPSLLTILIMIFYNMADMFFIARLGDTVKVASVSIVTPVFSTIMALSTMIGVGAVPPSRVPSAGETRKGRGMCPVSASTALPCWA